MAFERITDGDMRGKGNLGRPDTPGVDTAEMQRILDELPREVIVPAFNRLAEQLEAENAASALGASVPGSLPEGTPATVQGVLEAALQKSEAHHKRTDNPHAVTAAQTGAYTKEETEAAIGQRVVEIGAGDMARAIYDPAGEKRDVFAAIREAVSGAGHMEKAVYAAKGEAGAVDRALTADTALAADDGVKVYTHTKSGSVHDFAGTGSNGRVRMTADVEKGDTFTVNGVPATAWMGTEEAAPVMAGSPWNGRWLTFVLDGETINFEGGDGLTAGDKERLIPENIRTGVTIAKVTGSLLPSCKENSLACLWLRLYDNSNAPIQTNNVTEDSPISVKGTTITVERDFSAFVTKLPFANNTGGGASGIPEGQVSFEQGQTYSVSVSVPHGNNNMRGIVILFAING
ncbi:MAG TPA: hypothetical protein H9865_07355 [Candidatus Fournierella pullicola]|uniref:Uncharacterized protein n=1 Tax=Candidatus Allofournierella pullicola TaxID=2838596 RepID=A0A9D1V4H5_9FIRM|nr:hypothetical protein [Candidatus Fournierella pullicola]